MSNYNFHRQEEVRLSLIASAPVIDVDLRRSAEKVIAEFGDAAWAEAEERVYALGSEGFEFMAETCDLIHGVIGEIQEGSAQQVDGYRAAPSKGVSLSE